jgi:unsaturated chondroitin disaccharide hydrolase
MAGVFMNTPMTSQTGKFTARFSATPSASPTNGIVAFSMGPQTGFAGYAVSVRFNPMGSIDAVNGGAYGTASVAYTANTTYQFKVAVDVAAHTYSAWVTPPGGNETSIGMNYGFRTGQTTISALDSWGVAMQMAATGTVKACGFIVE